MDLRHPQGAHIRAAGVGSVWGRRRMQSNIYGSAPSAPMCSGRPGGHPVFLVSGPGVVGREDDPPGDGLQDARAQPMSHSRGKLLRTDCRRACCRSRAAGPHRSCAIRRASFKRRNRPVAHRRDPRGRCSPVDAGAASLGLQAPVRRCPPSATPGTDAPQMHPNGAGRRDWRRPCRARNSPSSWYFLGVGDPGLEPGTSRLSALRPCSARLSPVAKSVQNRRRTATRRRPATAPPAGDRRPRSIQLLSPCFTRACDRYFRAETKSGLCRTFVSGRYWTRTSDPLLVRQVLYQLS